VARDGRHCDNNPVPSTEIKTSKSNNKKRECAMARTSAASMPKQNPCAQCGKAISMPEWIESLPGGRTAFLWHCYACDYRFEAVAYFGEAATEQEPLAA
jgi:hypothetical protein